MIYRRDVENVDGDGSHRRPRRGGLVSGQRFLMSEKQTDEIGERKGG